MTIDLETLCSIAFDEPIAVDDRRVLARYYLKSEMGRLVPSRSATVVRALDRSIDDLSDHNLWRLLEAMAFTYRVNDMFRLITDTGLDWYFCKVPVEAIRLWGINPAVDEITHSKDIDLRPDRFGDFLRTYFAKHPKDDPAQLFEFRPLSSLVVHQAVMLRALKGELKMVDGSHRLMQMVLDGATSMSAYVAVRNGKPSRMRVGDSVFVRMRQLYADRFRRADQRESILYVTEMLASISTDGREAISTYWIDHSRSAAEKQVGAELLKRLKR